MPAPIATPISAAVSRSYSTSRSPLRRTRADAWGRGRLRGPIGVTSVAMVVLLRLAVGEVGVVDVVDGVRRKVHPTAGGQCGGAFPHAMHRGGRRHEQMLGFVLHDAEQRAELVEPVFRERHGVL